MPLISMAPYKLDDVRILQKIYFNFTISRQLYLHSMYTIACKALKVLYHFDDHCIELYICQQSTEKLKTFWREHNTGEGWAIFCLQSENIFKSKKLADAPPDSNLNFREGTNLLRRAEKTSISFLDWLEIIKISSIYLLKNKGHATVCMLFSIWLLSFFFKMAKYKLSRTGAKGVSMAMPNIWWKNFSLNCIRLLWKTNFKH